MCSAGQAGQAGLGVPPGVNSLLPPSAWGPASPQCGGSRNSWFWIGECVNGLTNPQKLFDYRESKAQFDLLRQHFCIVDPKAGVTQFFWGGHVWNVD